MIGECWYEGWEISRSISLFLFKNEWKRRTSDLENERQNLDWFKKTEEGKNSAQKTASSVQRRTTVSLFRSKIQKNSKRILQQKRENSEKIIRRRSPLGRNSTHHFVVLIYIHRALKIKCSRLREEGLPLRNEDIEAFSEEEEMVVVLSKTLKKKQTTF